MAQKTVMPTAQELGDPADAKKNARLCLKAFPCDRLGQFEYLQEGDVLVTKNKYSEEYGLHVGIYMDGGEVLHAVPKKGVCVDNLNTIPPILRVYRPQELDNGN